MEAPVACHFVNICQMNGVSRTCFLCILKATNLDITDDRFLVSQTGLQQDTVRLTWKILVACLLLTLSINWRFWDMPLFFPEHSISTVSF